MSTDRIINAGILLFLGVIAVRLIWPGEPPRQPVATDLDDGVWEQAISVSRPLFDAAQPADDVLVEFMDFECPFCAQWATSLDSMRATDININVRLVHFPLPGHDQAMPAAIAFECAARRGKARAMYHALFAGRDQFGERPWRDYAIDAGVPDLEDFDECITMPPDSFEAIREGLALAESAGVRQTPTLWLNGKALHDRQLGTIQGVIK